MEDYKNYALNTASGPTRECAHTHHGRHVPISDDVWDTLDDALENLAISDRIADVARALEPYETTFLRSLDWRLIYPLLFMYRSSACDDARFNTKLGELQEKLIVLYDGLDLGGRIGLIQWLMECGEVEMLKELALRYVGDIDRPYDEHYLLFSAFIRFVSVDQFAVSISGDEDIARFWAELQDKYEGSDCPMVNDWFELINKQLLFLGLLM